MTTLHRRTLETKVQGYAPQEWSGGNESGFVALNDLVVVLVDVVPEKIGSIYIAEKNQDTYTTGSTQGTIADVGPGAFHWDSDRTREFVGRKPQPGDRIVFERYAGTQDIGRDGKVYRIMQDRAIACIAE